jgi:hypothetical protein
MVLVSNQNADFKPHPEGIHPAVCLDVIDMGLQETEFQGQRKMVNKLRLVFETEQKLEDGRNCTISKNFTASLHPKAKLAEFLGKWRGRPVVPGETIDLGKLIGACCTIVVSHQQNQQGRTYAGIDAVSKPTKRLVPSGHYDPIATRQRIEEWKAKQAAPAAPPYQQATSRPPYGQAPAAPAPQPAPKSAAAPAAAGATRMGQPSQVAAPAASGPNMDYDPEVGF